MDQKMQAQPARCGCGASTSGRTALAVDPAIKDANLKHLRRIEGQVRGIIRMVDEDRYCADIVTQIAAIRESLNSVSKNLLRNHLHHCAAAAVRAGGEQADAMLSELVDLVGKIAR
jgi:CsoR family transcriptional regulator, copper-sensing transcriptional repressor